MGDVAVVLKLMPSGVDVDFEKIKTGIKNVVGRHSHLRLNAINEKPIGFGLKSLEIILVMPDSMGGTDKIEEELSSIQGVESVESGDVTLI